MTSGSGRLGIFPLDPDRLGGASAHPIIPPAVSIADLAPAALWATDERGACVAMAGAWSRFTGRPPEAAAGDGWLAFVHDEDRVLVRTAQLAAAARRERFEVEARFRPQGGGWRAIRIIGVPSIVEGAFQGFLGCAIDAATVRGEREQAIRERRALRRLTDLAPEPLLVADRHGEIEQSNPAAVRLLGGEAACSVDGASLDLLVPAWRSLPGATAPSPLVEVHPPDGTSATVRGWAELVPDPLGDRTVIALTRLSGVAEAEERRGRDGGVRSADLLHELSNVVTALLAGCELLQAAATEGRVESAELAALERNVRRVRQITHELKPPERGSGVVAPPAVERPPHRSEHPEETLAGLTVLVVDDDLAIRRSVRLALEDAGARVHDARQGADALLMWSEMRGQVDLVITDLRMPEMGGEELAERLRMLRPDLPILFVSGYALDRKVRRRPGDGYLDKPFGRIDLLRAAAAVVRQPGAGI